MSRYAPYGRQNLKYKATPKTVCQKCLQHGHDIYECKNERPNASGPSRTQRPVNGRHDPSMSYSASSLMSQSTKLEIENEDGGVQKQDMRKMLKQEGKLVSKRQWQQSQSPIYSIPFAFDDLDAAPFTFCNKTLFDSTNFLNILKNIRQHLLKLSRLQSMYRVMARKFYHALCLAMITPEHDSIPFALPTDEDFKHYILHKWPAFDCFDPLPTTNSIKWGSVSKKEGTPNQVDILSSIVMMAESPSRNKEIPFDLIITVVVLHELSHAFTKDYFDQIITPLGVGFKQGSLYGESGYPVEDEIVGGRLCVDWDSEDFDVGKIRGVSVKKGQDRWPIDMNAANNFLSSFEPLTLPNEDRERVPTRSLEVYVTDTTSNPCQNKPESACSGLGIWYRDGYKVWESFVGDDRDVGYEDM